MNPPGDDSINSESLASRRTWSSSVRLQTGPPLPPEVLAKRRQLPLKVAPVTLLGARVKLRPLDLSRDVSVLHRVTNGDPIIAGELRLAAYDPDALVWRYLTGGPFATAPDLRDWLEPQLTASNGLCLSVLDRSTGSPIGVVNYMNNEPAHLKVELGGIWYSPIVQGSSATRQASYLLLSHAFRLGYRRVEWKCDALNERSRRAALGLGFKFEGIQEAHCIIKGRNRDTAWFRMLSSEWSEVKTRLRERLGSTARPVTEQ